jgi:hypothetical protein
LKPLSSTVTAGLIILLFLGGRLASADPFDWISEFVYEMDAPDFMEEFEGKEIEKKYRLRNVGYEVSGTEVGAVIVIIHVKSQPVNEGETKLDFTAKARYVYAENATFDVKKERAEVKGYAILKEDKMILHVPWSEIFKNM